MWNQKNIQNKGGFGEGKFFHRIRTIYLRTSKVRNSVVKLIKLSGRESRSRKVLLDSLQPYRNESYAPKIEFLRGSVSFVLV